MSEFLEMLIPAVEDQMASDQTPFVRETYERLVADPDPALDDREVKMMIALCLADETERMLDEERPFNLARYKTLLDLLPTLPE